MEQSGNNSSSDLFPLLAVRRLRPRCSLHGDLLRLFSSTTTLSPFATAIRHVIGPSVSINPPLSADHPASKLGLAGLMCSNEVLETTCFVMLQKTET